MADEPTATPAETPVETAPAATTPPAETKPETAPAPEQTPEPDYRAAYVGLQRSQNKLHKRVEDVLAQNATLADTVRTLKEGQKVILEKTVGEDEAKAIEARQVWQTTQAAQLRAAQAADALITAQTGLFLEVLQEAGIDPNSRDIDWAQDASTPQEWAQRVGPSVKAALKKAGEAKLRQAEGELKAKTAKELAEERKALEEQVARSSGVDRIDTAKGGGATSTVQRILNLKPGTPEYRQFEADVAAGRLKT